MWSVLQLRINADGLLEYSIKTPNDPVVTYVLTNRKNCCYCIILSCSIVITVSC